MSPASYRTAPPRGTFRSLHGNGRGAKSATPPVSSVAGRARFLGFDRGLDRVLQALVGLGGSDEVVVRVGLLAVLQGSAGVGERLLHGGVVRVGRRAAGRTGARGRTR